MSKRRVYILFKEVKLNHRMELLYISQWWKLKPGAHRWLLAGPILVNFSSFAVDNIKQLFRSAKRESTRFLLLYILWENVIGTPKNGITF